ncbi:hypothetical protein [Psychroserpens sp. MEBiC05023]
MPKPKKILKIIGGVIIFFTLLSLLFFAYMYFKYNEELPTGQQGQTADQLAYSMLDVLDYEAYKTTDYIEFTFKKRHHYKWDKAKNTCMVIWQDYIVNLDFNDASNHKAYAYNLEIVDNEKLKLDLIKKAIKLFNNDTFWLVAPYKVFDSGVERRLVITKDNKEALLVTYNSGGSTPGDSYLWHFDSNGKPTSFQMWVDILPINGLEATWNNWTTTNTGAQLPTFHKLLFLGLEIDDIRTKTLSVSCTTERTPNPNNDGSTDEQLDDIYIKSCKFRNYKSVSISDPDYQGRTSWNYTLFMDNQPSNNSDLFTSNLNELELLLNKTFKEQYVKDFSIPELKECLKSIPFKEAIIDDYAIEFNEDNTIRFFKQYPVTNACLNLSFASKSFNIKDLTKYMNP